MNPNHPNRDALVAMTLALGIGALVGGFELALGSAATAGLAVLNLAVLRWLVERTTADLAAGGDGGMSGAMLSSKTLATLAVLLVVLQFVPPVAVVIGFAVVLGVTAVAATVHSLSEEASA